MNQIRACIAALVCLCAPIVAQAQDQFMNVQLETFPNASATVGESVTIALHIERRIGDPSILVVVIESGNGDVAIIPLREDELAMDFTATTMYAHTGLYVVTGKVYMSGRAPLIVTTVLAAVDKKTFAVSVRANLVHLIPRPDATTFDIGFTFDGVRAREFVVQGSLGNGDPFTQAIVVEPTFQASQVKYSLEAIVPPGGTFDQLLFNANGVQMAIRPSDDPNSCMSAITNLTVLVQRGKKNKVIDRYPVSIECFDVKVWKH